MGLGGRSALCFHLYLTSPKKLEIREPPCPAVDSLLAEMTVNETVQSPSRATVSSLLV